MHHLNSFLRTLNPLMAGTIVALGLSLPAFAEPSPANLSTVKQPMLLAQLAGQCRRVNRQVAVFTAPNCNSGASRLLIQGSQVTLNENQATNGFIGIQGGGFVQTANLTTCGTNPPPPGSLCRRVIQQQGLVIRSSPNPNAEPPVGFAPYNSRVTLTSNPPTVRPGPDGRNWVQISAPAAGWISNGVPGGASNLGMCP